MAIVTLDRLSKRYERTQKAAVEEVSLTVADGEFMVLLGPSGCGKTTTLRMIAGLESISSGKLAIDGRVVNAVPAKDRDIAMVFQSYALYPHMSVRQNLAFGLRRRGAERSEIERRVRDVAAALGLSELLDRRPHALSGGQRQRVALARALVAGARVVVLDDPMSAVDTETERHLVTNLRPALAGRTVLIATQRLSTVQVADRAVVLDDGVIVEDGIPADLLVADGPFARLFGEEVLAA
jgi:multiple sugar transport system ATP-binding protein